MRTKKLFIFDFDGVILNTEKYHFLSWKTAMAPFVDLQWQDYEPFKSVGRNKIMCEWKAKFNLEIGVELENKLKEEKGAYYNQLIEQLSKDDLIDGVLDYLNQLKQANRLTAVASSSLMAHQLIEKYDMTHFFDLILDANSKIKPKPSPDIFLSCAKQLHVDVNDCIVFEDSSAGIISANSAKMDCVYIGQLNHPMVSYAVKDFIDIRLQDLI